MKKSLMAVGSTLLVLSPAIALAANDLMGVMQIIFDLLNKVIPILIVLAMIYFIWGVIKYVVSGDEESKAKGRTMIIYGIIGLAVIVGVWGLVNILIQTFGIGGQSVQGPAVPNF